jgi:methylthioribose-1-phosphate isomerase
MKVGNKHYRSIWFDDTEACVKIIDQRWLPHEFEVITLESTEDFASAIREMRVRGAPLIGATAAWGMARAVRRDSSDTSIDQAWDALYQTRPTAVNLRWALDRMRDHLRVLPENQRVSAAHALALHIADEDVEINRQIGIHGLELISTLVREKDSDEPFNILTHCNAGWLATVDWGTATSPMYHAFDAGLNIHIWVDETRPRNQGALTAWELGCHGVPHTYIVDNAGGHLMQHGKVDMVLVGTDRTTASGDVCNKIGTYHKALAAYDSDVPFYVALPSPTIDWTVHDGVKEIPIEERHGDEIRMQLGRSSADSRMLAVAVPPDTSPVGNPAFDVTPARLVSGLITERGVVAASASALAKEFADLQAKHSA